MSTLMVVLLCVDAALLVGLLAFVVVSLLSGEKKQNIQVEQAEKTIEKQVNTEEVQVATEEIKQVEDSAATIVDNEDDREIAKRIPFAQKMLEIDSKTQNYYNALNNEFCSMRKINPRVSMKGVSYRLGRELVAKITIRGKTMRLHLALDVKDFQQSVFFQKDLSDVKSYAEVPLMVKVKSDRGLKNALRLVDALAQNKAIERKIRFTAVDSIEELKEKI